MDYDEEQESKSVIRGTMVVEMEVQRPIQRAELWTCVTTLEWLHVHATIHTDTLELRCRVFGTVKKMLYCAEAERCKLIEKI